MTEKEEKRLKHNEQCRAWRQAHPDKIKNWRSKNYEDTRQLAWNSRQVWNTRDNFLVLNYLGTDRELSALIGRSTQAIQIQRVKLKRKYDARIKK